jgi:IS605 OrfB family transposase
VGRLRDATDLVFIDAPDTDERRLMLRSALQPAVRWCQHSPMSTITRSYRIRAYPNGAQRRLLDRWFGATRWLWNTALGIRCEAYRECGLKLTGSDLSRWLTSWKHTAGHEWLAEVPATCLTQCLRDQDAAFRNFFAGRARYPRFKRKSTCGSVRFQDVGLGWARGRVCLPKLGALKLAESLPKVECALHRLTARLVKEFDLICIEDLNVKGLARGLHARAIHDVAFSEVRRQLTYKSDWYGKILVAVDRWYPSSKRCSECQYTLDVLRLDERRCSQRKREAGNGIEPVLNR